MKATLFWGSAIEKAITVIAFFPVILMVYPQITAAAYTAQNPEEPALVFQVNSKAKTEILPQDQLSITYDELVLNEPLVRKVREYLESKGSPLAEYTEEMVLLPQWQRALAISFVESNFGKYCANNNCSGIGVSPSHPSWRKYPTKLDWFIDMSALLEKPIYKERYTTCAKMKGVYVVPGSSRWVYGCDKVSNELLAITKEAEIEKMALVLSK
jgi:hypothetical protein